LTEVKRRLVEELRSEIEACAQCSLCGTVKNRVLGEGDLDSRVVFVGEAPGRREDESGRPFVGSAGKLLDGILAKAGLSRGGVFISNVVMCRPPGNRRPRREEVEACSVHLERLLAIIEPRVVAPMGNSSVDYVFGRFGLTKGVIGDVHGRAVVVKAPWGELVVFPLYHPAAAIYNRRLLGELEADMVELAGLLR
jgi:DNA polymerase